MRPINRLIREIYPSIYVTPISVMQSLTQLAMGDHVPMDNPPFGMNPKHTKELWQRNSMA